MLLSCRTLSICTLQNTRRLCIHATGCASLYINFHLLTEMRKPWGYFQVGNHFRSYCVVQMNFYLYRCQPSDIEMAISMAQKGSLVIYEMHVLKYTQLLKTKNIYITQKWRTSYLGFKVFVKSNILEDAVTYGITCCNYTRWFSTVTGP